MTTVVPKVYNWSDPEAPQITANQPQSMLNVLFQCLVGSGGTAYGSTPAAGWSAPFNAITTSTQLVLQQGSGGMRMLQLSGSAVYSAGSWYGYQYIGVRGYDAMTDVNTGTGQFPTTAQCPTFFWAYACASASTASNTTIIPWRIIATDRLFYVIFYSSAGGNSHGSNTHYFFGDIYSYVSGDTQNTVLFADNNLTQDAGTTPAYSSNNNWYCYPPWACSTGSGNWNGFMYAAGYPNGNASAIEVAPLTTNYALTNWYSGWGALPNPDPSGQFSIYPVECHEHDSTGYYNLRGMFPGIYMPAHTRPFTDGQTLSFDGNTYVVWMPNSQPGENYGYQQMQVIICTSGWEQN